MRISVDYTAPGAQSVSAKLDGETVVFIGSPQAAEAILDVRPGRHTLDWFITAEPGSEYRVAAGAHGIEGDVPEAGSATGSIRFGTGGREAGSAALVLAVAAAAVIVTAILLARR